MAYTILPEYEFYTGVEIKLYLGGDKTKVIELSKFGEHFKSLTISEGTTQDGGPQVQAETHEGSVARGRVTLYDEYNLIYRTLLVSKTSGGNPLQNLLDITVKTYTGIRSYNNCRVEKWSCNFNGGVPEISLDWQMLPSSAQQSESTPTSPSFNEVKMREAFVTQGVTDFAEFKKSFRETFTDAYTFKYAPNKVLEDSQLKEIGDDGKITYYNEEGKQETLTITIPESIKESTAEDTKRYRMRLDPVSDTNSMIKVIMDKFVHDVNTELKPSINWKIHSGNTILIYTFNDYGSMTIPQPPNTPVYLEETVFVYNSSLTQGSIYKTPQGDSKKVFIIENISTTFDFSNQILVNFDSQANANNPNGNLVLTSRGSVYIPSGVPQAISDAISKLSSILLKDDLKVNITVYNFIHFYVLGETKVNIIVYDHLGQIHPLTGAMRVDGYTYTIDGGVIKADVTLRPPFTATPTDFAPASSNPSTNTTSYPPSSATEYPPSSNASGAGMSSGVTIQSGVDYKVS